MSVVRDGADDTEHGITNDLGGDEVTRVECAGRAWALEGYHPGLKKCAEGERGPARLARSQRNHIGFAVRAFSVSSLLRNLAPGPESRISYCYS